MQDDNTFPRTSGGTSYNAVRLGRKRARKYAHLREMCPAEARRKVEAEALLLPVTWRPTFLRVWQRYYDMKAWRWYLTEAIAANEAEGKRA